MNRTHFKTPARWGCFAVVVLLFVLVAQPGAVRAQSFGVSGFVKSSYYYDTRQVVAARNTEFLLWPVQDANPDGDDATDTDNLSSYQIFSRVGLSVDDMPQVMGADVSGYIETDFFGPTGDETNTLRIRRAFAKMVWDNREVQFGVEWSPMFTLAAFPHIVDTEAGTPFNPFARQPMIKLTLKPGNLRLIGAAAWQFDAFQSAAFPDPNFASPQSGIDQQQRSALPGMHGQVQYVTENLTVGGGGYVKSLRPVATGDRMFTSAGLAYVAYSGETFNMRAKGIYGGDLHDHVKTSGIVYDPGEDSSPGAFDADAFQALNSFSAWLEVEGKGTLAPGIFGGYLTNLGASDDLTDPDNAIATGRGTNIDNLWEVAPRLVVNQGPMRFAFEVQVTNATFASDFDASLAPDGDTESTTNVRGNFTVFLFF